ncbi:malonyl-CoA decarboxylase [Tabrizicola sp.]|uniref:malonyl-CoA decarboxylase n=1 Tax=Tabrizicola sp. TaxID=2005166 RepID=UPI002639AD40|nr:malonyl-CoA decarboxylase [Tabrizicola sp.]MDM7931529.1 malonyl-CoA decarboxylase [Tabrizicola sp.]
MTMLADLLASVFDRRKVRQAPAGPSEKTLSELACDLVGGAGEASGLASAFAILSGYDSLDDAGKLAFFRMMAVEMNISADKVRQALDAYEASPSKVTYRDFAAAAEPPRQELIRRLNRAPGATGGLVRMRADLLRLGRGEPGLEALDLDFRHLLASWFNRGFLVLRPISWESPAHVLEKIIAYEAVHAIDSWDDLRRRLEPADRRCFAFFHPAMPDEPLIFVEVALMRGVAQSIQTLLAESREVRPAEEADTAVFYSISNCQPGLAGISFGNSLIKQVAADLSQELPGLRTFVTLSPLPGFAKWLAETGIDAATADRQLLCAFGAHYLVHAKDRTGMPIDPVARFHLGNGAIVHQVHADADTSAKGLGQSAGLMVNYLYDLGCVAQNHELFATKGDVAHSTQIRALCALADKTIQPGKKA